MKKFLGVCLSLVLFASCCGVLVGCGEERFQIDDGTSSSNNVTNLAGYSVDIQDASSLGVAQVGDTMKLIKTSNVLLADNVIETSYTEVNYIDKNGDLFDIDKSGLEVYQMYVTPDYTFVSYISQNVRKFAHNAIYYTDQSENIYDFKYPENIETDMFHFEEGAQAYYFYNTTKNTPENFNTTKYKNTKYQRSYIISNETGKIYDTAKMLADINGEYFNIENNLLNISYKYNTTNKRNSDYYNFEINANDELVITQLLPNADVNVLNAFKDKNGYVYVSNTDINMFNAENNILYTTQNLTLGSDGYVYADNHLAELCRLNGDKQEKLSECADVEFENGKYLIKVSNGVLYTHYLGDRDSYTDLKCYDITNGCTELDVFAGNGYDANSGVIFTMRVDGLYVYNEYDVLNNYLGEATKLLGVCDFTTYLHLENGVIKYEDVIKEVTPSETNYYKFGKDENGDAVLIKLANTQYTGTIITLQPIN